MSRDPSSEPPQDGLWDLTPCGGCARKAPASVALEFARVSGLDGHGSFMSDIGIGEIDGKRFGFTVDFITPLVPDAADFGRIAAANALSDVYAGGDAAALRPCGCLRS